MIPRRRVLYIDDADPPGRALPLEACCYDVIVTRDLAEALRAASTTCFDVYLVDGESPGNLASDFCVRVRAFDAWTPVFFAPSGAEPWELEQTVARMIAEGELRRREWARAWNFDALAAAPRPRPSRPNRPDSSLAPAVPFPKTAGWLPSRAVRRETVAEAIPLTTRIHKEAS